MRQENDKLTGLYSKEKALELIQDYLENTQEQGVAIVVDIDNFAQVNNLFGMEKGDEILKDTSITLKQFFQDDDIICRTQGDHFIVFAKKCEESTNLNIRLYELCTTLECEVTDGLQSCMISVSIGVATTASIKRDFNELYRCACEAMDEVKHTGKDAVKFYRCTAAL